MLFRNLSRLGLQGEQGEQGKKREISVNNENKGNLHVKELGKGNGSGMILSVNSRLISQALFAVLLALGANLAQAGVILGDSVDVAVHAPNLGEVCFLCGGVTRVSVTDDASDAVEPYLEGGDWFQVDVNSNSISISFNRDVSWQSGNFVGLVISDIDWLEGAVRSIPGAQLVTSLLSSDQVNSRLQHTDTSVAFNWQGMTIPAGTRFDIQLAAASPIVVQPGVPINVNEPSALLLLLGMAFLIVCRNIGFTPLRYFRTA